MVSGHQRREVSLWLLGEETDPAQAEDVPSFFIGGRRLGAWEAVVFGSPYVESALAVVLRAGLLADGAMATETSVEMLVRLECVLITLYPSIGSYHSQPLED
jgi:hypothetical protein